MPRTRRAAAASVPSGDDPSGRVGQRQRFGLRLDRLAGRAREALPGLDRHCSLSAAPRSTSPATRRAPGHRPFAKNPFKRWPALSTFTHTAGVEPTNNHAERGLRGALIYRKLSPGSQSDQGERTIEPLLPTSLTCRLRKQSLHDYLTQLITAHARGDPIPTLA